MEATVRWIRETSDKRTAKEDISKLRWLHPILGNLSLDQISLNVIDTIKKRKLKEASKATVNRYLNLVRAILNKAKNEWEWIDGLEELGIKNKIVINQRLVRSILIIYTV